MAQHTPSRAALYLRQSLDRTGTGLAVERQRADCTKLATERGWEVVAEYVDNDVSASSRKPRAAYVQMLADTGDGRFQHIVCWHVDRLTRKLTDLESLIELAERTGVTVATVSGDVDLSTDQGRLIGRILASVARGEMERKSARQIRAARQRAENGRPAVTRAFGYTPDGMKLVPDEAALVGEMFTRLLAGETIKGITEWMNTTGVSTSTGGSTWSRTTVRNLLLRPRYAGIATYHGAEIGVGTWPAIVDEPTYRAAAAVLTDPKRRHNRTGSARKYLGSGLYVCGVCGAAVRTTGRTVESSYLCPAQHVHRSRQRVDELVTAVIEARLRQPDVADLLVRDEADLAEPLRQEAGVLRLRLEQAAADYAAGLMDGHQLHHASERIRERLAEVEQALADLGRQNGLGAVLAASDPADAFAAAPLGVQRAVIAAICTVRLHRGSPGRVFDPTSVEIAWKGGTE